MKDLLMIIAPYAVAVAFIGAVTLIIRTKIRHKREYGNLKWRGKRRVRGVVFGRIRTRRLCSLEKHEGHIACFGGSGSGKTSALLIPTLRAWRGTAFVIDISGDIEKNVPLKRADFDKMRFKRVISLFKGGLGLWDVLYTPDAENAVEGKITRLMELSFALIPDRATSDDTSAFYLEESRKMLQAALIAFYFADLEFTDICRAILRQSADELIEDIQASKQDTAVALASGFVGSNDKTLTATKQEVDKAISLFALDGSVASRIGRGGFAPETLERDSLYLVIPDEKLELYSPFMRLVTAQVMNYLSARDEGKKTPILLALDEFSSLGKLDILPALRKLRKRRVRIIAITQSLADLELAYGKPMTRSMLENFQLKIVMACSEYESQRFYSDLSGQHEGADGRRRKNIEPDHFGTLQNRKRLILFHPAGFVELRKNFYFKNAVFSRLWGVLARFGRGLGQSRYAKPL